MAISNVLYSSESEMWETPKALFDKLDTEFHFDIDVCALHSNAKCATFFTPEQDGLKQKWKGVCWMNPPYGRKIGEWMRKALESKTTVVCLVPARTDTKWWHEYAMKASEIRFVKGRLKFGDSKNSAPFPSAIIVFRKNNNENIKVTSFEKG